MIDTTGTTSAVAAWTKERETRVAETAKLGRPSANCSSVRCREEARRRNAGEGRGRPRGAVFARAVVEAAGGDADGGRGGGAQGDAREDDGDRAPGDRGPARRSGRSSTRRASRSQSSMRGRGVARARRARSTRRRSRLTTCASCASACCSWESPRRSSSPLIVVPIVWRATRVIEAPPPVHVTPAAAHPTEPRGGARRQLPIASFATCSSMKPCSSSFAHRHLEGPHPVGVRPLLHQPLERRVVLGAADALLDRCDATRTSAARTRRCRRLSAGGAGRRCPGAVGDPHAVLVRVAAHQRQHAVDRPDRVARVERRHDEVTRLGGLEGDLHRLLVADLADEDDVGVLPERRAQRRREARGVEPDLALAEMLDMIVPVEELDRVLDGDDVQRLRRVEVRRPCWRSTCSCRCRPRRRRGPSRSAARPARASRGIGRPERLERRDVERDEAHHDRERAALPVDVDAEAADPLASYDVSYSFSSSSSARAPRRSR